jgi:hypothetical protein
MALRSEVDLARADGLDVIRYKTRLKHRIQMRHELNDLEADYLAEFNERVQRGLPFEPDVAGELEDLT